MTKRTNQPYTNKELRHMCDAAKQGDTPAQIATTLGRTTKGIELQLHLKGINKTKRARKFTPKQCGRIIVSRDNKRLALEMGVTTKQITSKRADMKYRIKHDNNR